MSQNVQIIHSSLREVALQGMLGDEFEHFSHLVVSRRRPLCWVVSCERISAILRLINRVSYYIRCVGVKMAVILALNSHSLRLHLGNCRVSLVEGMSCVCEVRQTLVYSY